MLLTVQLSGLCIHTEATVLANNIIPVSSNLIVSKTNCFNLNVSRSGGINIEDVGLADSDLNGACSNR